MLRKRIIGLISFILILTVTSIVLDKISVGTESIYSEVEESMEETEKENKKLREVLTKVLKELQNQGYDRVMVSFSNTEYKFLVQVKDEEFLKKNRSKVKRIILSIAEEEEFHDFE